MVRAIETAEGGSPATNGQNAVSRLATGHRDTTITRLAVLKAAAEFAAARPSLKSGDVLTIAASWERWVRSSDAVGADEDHGLVDAF